MKPISLMDSMKETYIAKLHAFDYTILNTLRVFGHDLLLFKKDAHAKRKLESIFSHRLPLLRVRCLFYVKGG